MEVYILNLEGGKHTLTEISQGASREKDKVLHDLHTLASIDENQGFAAGAPRQLLAKTVNALAAMEWLQLLKYLFSNLIWSHASPSAEGLAERSVPDQEPCLQCDLLL